MTDAEIKKALECHCRPVCCIDCPMHNREHDNCVTELWSLSLDLINRQQAEIERLLQKLQQPQSEAIKEFAERLKKELINCPKIDIGGYTYFPIGFSCIDNLVKEMAGDAE